MKKIISFSLWGSDHKYWSGAFANIKLAPKIYPGWTLRFYIPRSECGKCNSGLINEFGLCNYKWGLPETDTNVEIVLVDEPGDWRGMTWRFFPASEDDIDVMISRDCDSRISEREAAAVNEWIKSPALVHSMADHPYHFDPKLGLMGGMCGFKKYAFPSMKEVIAKYLNDYPIEWQHDQSLLRDHIYPYIKHKIFATSDIHSGCHPFSIKRDGLSFVGETFDESDQPNQEHRAILKRYIDSI